MATKKSKAYWINRFDQVEQSGHNISLKHTRQLEKKYKIAAKEIDTKINAWYNRIAKNNNVSVADARKLLTKSELAEFKWDVEEYIKRGQENAFDQRWMKELENASAKFHINRLEALKLEVRQQIEQAFAGGQQSMFDTLADVYKDSFYRSCYEVQKGFGVGFDVSALSNKQVQSLLNKPWSVDGVNFSQKIWNNKVKLINTLDQEMTKMVLTGAAPQQTIQNIKKAMDTSLFNAKRLVLTEQAYFTTIGQKDAFGELDVEEYEVVATLDSRTSEICQGMDGKHFPVKDMQAGVNAPPFHPLCRSTTCPYFDDEFSLEDKRVAKDEETGEWYEIPASMSYSTWHNEFVKGGKKEGLHKLGAGANSISGDTTRIELGQIEPKDIELFIEEFAEQIRHSDVENALVVDKNGNAIQFISNTDSSVSIFDVDLDGATVIHNHPLTNGVQSFGEDDFMFLRDNQTMKSFRCCNEEYDYSVNVLKDMTEVVYNKIYIEAMGDYVIGDDLQHLAFEVLKQKGYVNYERKAIFKH